MPDKYIKNYTLKELEEEVQKLGLDRYRAEQIFRAVYVDRIEKFEDITTLPIDMRKMLEGIFVVDIFKGYKIRRSSDGSVKFLFELHDGKAIEAVYMPWESDDGDEILRVTLCISSMAGCPVGCAFCATGTLGFRRNLEPGEIVGQILAVEKELGCKVDNVVFMGMGEPLLNYKNITRSLDILTDEKAKLLSRRKITLSTSGVAPRIKQLAGEPRPVKLAISLHATTDETRSLIMPISKSYSLEKLMDAIEFYYRKTKMDITYEYIMFDSLNDTPADLKRLTKIARRVPSKVNIIPFNDISFTQPQGISAALKPTPRQRIQEFASGLRNNGVAVIVRDTFGADIEAACGQLALSEEKNAAVPA